MNNKFPTGLRLLAVLLISLVLSGCANKPFLTPDNTYAIVTASSDGKVQTTPITLPWNANQAVLQKLLFEASFVLSELRTLTSSTQSTSANISPNSEPATFLMTNFPESKKLLLNIDGLTVNMDVQSIQVEVQGPDVGRVVLNESWALQGISDPNLSPAFLDFLAMLQHQKDSGKSNSRSNEQKNPINPAAPADQAAPAGQTDSPDQTSPTDQTGPAAQASPTDQAGSAAQASPTEQAGPAHQANPAGQSASASQANQVGINYLK